MLIDLEDTARVVPATPELLRASSQAGEQDALLWLSHNRRSFGRFVQPNPFARWRFAQALSDQYLQKATAGLSQLLAAPTSSPLPRLDHLRQLPDRPERHLTLSGRPHAKAPRPLLYQVFRRHSVEPALPSYSLNPEPSTTQRGDWPDPQLHVLREHGSPQYLVRRGEQELWEYDRREGLTRKTRRYVWRPGPGSYEAVLDRVEEGPSDWTLRERELVGQA